MLVDVERQLVLVDRRRTVSVCLGGLHISLVEQLVDLAALRLAAVFADRPSHRGEEPEFGIDNFADAHIRSRLASSGGDAHGRWARECRAVSVQRWAVYSLVA